MRHEGSLRRPDVARAFEAVPRHRFVPGVTLEEAYADRAISIKSDGGETLASISQPSMLARMLELAEIEPGHRVLEIGTGSGYNAALIAEIAGTSAQVVTVEVESDLSEHAREALAACGYDNVRVVLGDGREEVPGEAPFDRVIVSARANDVARAWWQQLRDGGRIIVPLDIGAGGEYAVGFTRYGDELRSVGVVHCLFVPLRGELGTAPPERVFTRTLDVRYGSQPRPIKSILAVPTTAASPELLERADVVVAQPQTTFAVTWG